MLADGPDHSAFLLSWQVAVSAKGNVASEISKLHKKTAKAGNNLFIAVEESLVDDD